MTIIDELAKIMNGTEKTIEQAAEELGYPISNLTYTIRREVSFKANSCVECGFNYRPTLWRYSDNICNDCREYEE